MNRRSNLGSELSLCLAIFVSLSGCGKHIDGKDIITQKGAGVGAVPDSLSKTNKIAKANSSTCETKVFEKTALSALQMNGYEVSESSLLVAEVGPIGYPSTDTQVALKFSASMKDDKNSKVADYISFVNVGNCQISGIHTLNLSTPDLPETACEYSKLISDKPQYSNLNGNSGFKMSEVSMTQNAKTDGQILQVYRILTPTSSPASNTIHAYGGLVTIDASKCQDLTGTLKLFEFFPAENFAFRSY
jgi:hypothetical protein